ncbi:amidohydrolase [Candidatus Thorarchaeota archaeon]|nr:MAG: amidohydrolase [Candidatus Thorarchaeota archaeon]
MELEADLVVFNGKVVTMNPENPEATAMAVKNYKFLVVGDDDSVIDLVGTAKRVIDLGGKTVVPGFIDAHTHITYAGMRASHIDLGDARSIEEVKKILRGALPLYSPGEWIRGYNWDESKWKEDRYVTADDLDEVSTEHPIAIDRVDMHLTSANTLALEKFGLPPEKEGVITDKKGKPTGVLKDIVGLFGKGEPGPKNLQDAIVAATSIANKHGITTAVDNIQSGFLKAIRDCERKELLTARLVVNPRVENLEHMVALGITSGLGGPMVRIGGVKLFTDGSIGARTAAVSEPYKDDPENTGKIFTSEEELREIYQKAIEHGIQTLTHAIGDAAIEAVLNAFESLEGEEREQIRLQRHRIEHAEMISEYQIRRAVSLGLILSMQPNFVAQWQLEGGLYDRRFEEERVRGMNMFRVALDNGARVAFGSDGMPYGPLYGIWAAATHPNPRVRLTVEEALRCYTLEAAYSSFMERIAGSIQVGKRADFVVLSDHILDCKPEKIKDIRVESTFVGGIEEYSAIKE